MTSMTDQEITALFNSPDIIVFYTPKGMEIGFNYDEGWVTVTYEEYEQYPIMMGRSAAILRNFCWLCIACWLPVW